MADPDPASETARLATLRALAARFPDEDAVLAGIAARRAALTLPKGTIHVVSDVHGEYKKLRHIINNASGSLRPLVDRLFADRAPAERLELLALMYYPQEAWGHFAPGLGDDAARMAFLRRVVAQELVVLRELARRYSQEAAEAVYPPRYRAIFRELVGAPELGRSEAWLDAVLRPFVEHGRSVELLRMTAHVIRNLTAAEIIVAGDLGDRGPRVDKVIDYLMRQPDVAITWGNHDAEWMGACLGQPACIATVLRISLRYGRLSQLEAGYGIPVEPLEKLARTVYGDDPAGRFACKNEKLRDPLLLARMQKAAAVMQFKLEGQTSRRNPGWALEHRNLLHRIDPAAGTVTVDGVTHPMLDSRFPTVDWRDPYALSPEEAECLALFRDAFFESATLWDQMRFVLRRGATWLRRDDTLIFHGCVPCDEGGRFLPLAVNGEERAGRALFDAIGRVVQRAFRGRAEADVDLLWYLWSGPLSPMFGKDRMATFETYFIADEATHKETKNPYFKLLHDADFCRSLAREFGVDPARVLVVNGHVPVKLEAGESPVKKGGLAVTIDGAFSEAYGDKGYTLVLDAARTYLAQHHHFESVGDAITQGADIIPTVQDLRVYDPPRTVADTEDGAALREDIALLDELWRAYEENLVARPGT